jgi:hypothetical protein
MFHICSICSIRFPCFPCSILIISHHFSSFLRISPDSSLVLKLGHGCRRQNLVSTKTSHAAMQRTAEENTWSLVVPLHALALSDLKFDKLRQKPCFCISNISSIKRYQKFQRRTISKAFLLRRTPFKRAASQQFQTNPAFSAPGLSPVTFIYVATSVRYVSSGAVQPGCRRQRQAQSSMLFAECVQPPRKKNTQDSMYFYYVHSKPIYNFCLWPPMAYAYWVSAPENWSPPCHKAADALRLLWPITGKHLAHWAQYFWGSKKCSAIAMPSRDSRDPGALNFPFWWLQIAEWTESSCNSVGSLRDPKLHPFPKFTCRTYRRQVSDIADI